MKSSFQVAKFGILLSACVVFLFISCKKDTSTEKILVKPVALPATNYTPVSFTANWELNGAVSYNLYVATDSMFVNPVNGFNPKSVTGDSINLSGLPSNTNYFYRVTAVNDKGQETIPSNIIAVTTPDPQADRYVYIGSEDKNLYCLYAGTGGKVWTFATAGDIEASPTISAGVLYFSSTDQRLYAIDPIAGTSKWGFLTGGASISSPCSGTDGVYISSYSGFVYGVNLNGSKKWGQQPAGVSRMFSSPTFSNGIVYIGGQDNNLYAYDAESGSKIWSAPTGDSISSSPAVANGIVYVGSFDKSVYAFDAATGAPKWKVGTSDSVLSSPTVSNGIVYVGSY